MWNKKDMIHVSDRISLRKALIMMMNNCYATCITFHTAEHHIIEIGLYLFRGWVFLFYL